MSPIRIAQSRAQDATTAVLEFYEGVVQPDTALVLFFCSSRYDRDVLAREINRRFGDTPVIGCTTAGEIGPEGYLDHTLAGVSFSASAFTAVTGRVDRLREFSIAGGQATGQGLRKRLNDVSPGASTSNSFGLLLIDGLSVREELVSQTLQAALGDIPLIGGSAADDLQFKQTWVFHEGAFHTDSALLTLITTSLPFQPFKTQHFIRQEERLVVTEADTQRRIVREINGLPAADEYARLIGVARASLAPSDFAAAPLVVMIGGTDYVRSIQKVNQDGSLTFYCAIEEGLVLRVAKGIDLEANLQQTLDRLRAELGPLQLMVACDCILRNLEITQRGSRDQVSRLFVQHRGVGFNTYGEQYGGVHVNQTLTGIAFGGDTHE